MHNATFQLFFNGRIYLACLFLLLQLNSYSQTEQSILSVFETASSLNPFDDLRGLPKRHLKDSQVFNEKRLKEAQLLQNHKATGLAAGNLALTWLQKSDYDKALLYTQIALESFTKIDDARAIAVCIGEMGYIYDKRNDDVKALSYYNNALEKLQPVNAPKIAGALAGSASVIYLQQQDTVSFRRMLQKATDNFKLAGNKKAEANLFLKLGEVYLLQSKYPSAASTFEKSYLLFNQLKNNKAMAIANRNIGIVYFKKGDYDKALQYFERSIKEDKEMLVQKLIKDTYLKIVTVSSFNKDYTKADIFHNKYRTIKKTLAEVEKTNKDNPTDLEEQLLQKEKIIFLLNQQNSEQSKILTAQDYELSQQLTATEIERQSKEKALEALSITEQKKAESEAQLKLISKEKAIQELILSRKELELERQNKFRNYLLIAAGVALLLTFFLFNRYRYKKRSLDVLNRAHDELQDAHTQLKAAQQQLIQSEKMASLGLLTSGIAHEIQNPLNFVNNFSRLSAESIEEFLKSSDPDEKQEIIKDVKLNLEKINHHGSRISEIVKGMLQHSRNDSGEKNQVDINALIEDAVQLAYHGKRSTEFDFKCVIEKAFDKNLSSVKLSEQDFRRVILNFANNAFYAVYEKEQLLRKQGKLNGYVPTLNVSTIKQSNNAAVIIRDNGMGIPEDIKSKIFNPFFTSKPTGQGTGLGLSISYDIITKSHNGRLTFESEINQGSTFFITIPIS